MIDVLVAGAGPVGLTAAIAAARAGLEVVVVDPHPEGPIDKSCGEGLMPVVLDAFADLGVHLEGRPFVGIRYLRGDVVAEGRFERPGLGVRRTHLSAVLQARAAELGVRREIGRVVDVRQDDDGVTAGPFRARWLLAADGMRSSLRRELGLDAPAPGPARYGLRRHFAVAPWADTVDVHFADDAEAYVTPVGDRLVGIAILYGDAARDRDHGSPERPFDRLLARFPDLAARLHDPASEARGLGPFQTRSAARASGRALLLGDAAGYIDAITGEGIKLGALGAIAAVDAIRAGDPARYEDAWQRAWRTYQWSTEGLLALTRRPALRAALPRVLRAQPWIFDRALRVLAS